MKRKKTQIKSEPIAVVEPIPVVEPDRPMTEQERRELAYENRGEVDEDFEPVAIPPMTLPQSVSLEEAAWWAFVKLVHEDQANAAMHCASVRYSPLTFSLAKALNRYRPQDPYVQQVMVDVGLYQEDPGR